MADLIQFRHIIILKFVDCTLFPNVAYLELLT